MNRISLTLTFLLSLCLIACEGSDADAPTGDPMVLSSQALHLNASPLDLVGVAVDPMTGSRFVLDRDNQLYDLSAQGHVTPRLDLQEVWGADPMQDLCAVSDSEIFTVAPGFGIKVNLDTSEAQSHFCLEPEDEPGQMNDWDAWRHETHAIACDLESALIYGQPQTLPRDDENGAPVRSEVSLYDLPSGEDIGWYPLPSELFIAGGMVVIDELTYMLGYKYLDDDRVLQAIANRPVEQSVVVTGRGGGSALREAADTVSEVDNVKHAFKAGIKARAGVDY
ncbi:cob(I)yrinic acid a,c-diamide adenosyltransferase [uncultured Salinisphaera sp.]|uniref:cob(I)yrinic acid a,c-diamide adenosyltransferase n=1 Tax=uncultured Salinisphaera sp. TaxID=359372 RepID=UPI0032B2E96E